jgi:exonuclease III
MLKVVLLFFIFNLFNLSNNILKADTECPNVISNEDRRYDKNTLRLVQYNVEWLFIDYYTSSDCPGNGCTWKNLSEAQTHMNYVSEVIKKLDPDIINFCEIEGCDELNMLNSMVNETYLPYLKKGTDTSTGQNVGLLTKIDPIQNLYRTELKYNYPITGSNCGYTGSISSTGVSKHYITEFKINNIDIAFIAAHLIAIPTDPTRCSQREAQAMILQTIIYSYISDNYEIIMMGDFNDYDSEILDMNNDKPISHVLDILKGYYGTYSGEYQLFSVAENISQNKRYSDWWDSDNNCNTASIYDYSMIDHILVSSLLRKYISDIFIYHGYLEYCGKYNSDHYPVVVDFKF